MAFLIWTKLWWSKDFGSELQRRDVRNLMVAAPALDWPYLARWAAHLVQAVPHSKLFSRCAAIVHHGGAGTTAAAARAGIPQLIIPQMTDQFYWRGRLIERQLTPGVVSLDDVDGFAAAPRTCVEDEALKARARTFSSGMRTDGLERAVEMLTQ